MGLIKTLGRYAWRKYVTDGVFSSGYNKPDQIDIFPFVDAIDNTVSALSGGGELQGGWDASGGVFPGAGSATTGQSWIATTAGTVGGVAFRVGDRVIALTDNASTSVYAGNWQRLPAAVDPIVPAEATGGTANAIEATTSEAITGDASQVISILWAANNTGAATVRFNGEDPAYPIKTRAGADVQEDYLVDGVRDIGQIVGGNFQLLSEVGTAAAAAAAQAAADEAVGAANSVAVKYAADDTALQALTGVNDKAIFNLANEGWWLPISDDISAEITAGDPRYLPTSGDATGASGGFYKAGSVQTGNFFAEDGARIIPLADRAFGGDSVQSNGEAVATYVGSYMAGTAGIAADGTARLPGLGWVERNAGFSWAVSGGKIAVSGYSHSLGVNGGASIGGAFTADNDETTNTSNAWAGYFDAKRWPGAKGTTWGIELDISNHGSTVNDSAYGADAGGGVTRGIDIAVGGGQPAMGVSNPVSVGLRFSANGGTFLKGIILSSSALYNYGGYKVAVEMGQGQRLQWLANTNKDLGSFIQSDVATSGKGQALRFADDILTVEDLSGNKLFAVDRVASAATYAKFTPAATGGVMALSVISSDTNGSIKFLPQAAGELQFQSGAGASKIRVNNSGVGFHGTAPTAKQTITGSRGSNAALADLLTKLATIGLLTDSTT